MIEIIITCINTFIHYIFGVRHIYHCAKLYLNNVKVLEMGQYDLVKDDLYKIFDYHFLNLKGLTSKTFNLLKV